MENLREKIYKVTGNPEALKVSDSDLFDIIGELMPFDDGFFEVLCFARELKKIDEEKTYNLLKLAYEQVEKRLGNVDGASMMGWQKNPDDKAIVFVKKTSGIALLMDKKDHAIAKNLLSILSYNGEEFPLQEEAMGCKTLKKLLLRNCDHTVIIDYLSDPNNWHKWPELLMEKINSKRLSRASLASDIGLKGKWKWLLKRRVVKLLQKEIKK